MKRSLLVISAISLIVLGCNKANEAQATIEDLPAEIVTEATTEEAPTCCPEAKVICDSLKAAGETCSQEKCDSLEATLSTEETEASY